MFKVIFKQTPMGQFHFQLVNVKTSEVIATSKDYDTRTDGLTAVHAMEGAWSFGMCEFKDLTPEGRKIANGKEN